MRRRTARPRTTPLGITRLEDRTVPHGHGEAALVALPAQFYLQGESSTFLTGPQAGDYRDLAHQALKAHAAALGLTPADVADPVVTDTLSEGGLSHVYYRQKLNGLPVLNANIGVHLTAAGEVITINGGFVPGLSALETGTPPAPALAPVQAVAEAAGHFGITLTSDPAVLRVEPGANPRTIVSAPGGSIDEVPVNLTYTTTSAGVRLAWELVLNVPGGEHWYHTAVDAQTGEVVFWADWVNAFGPGYKVQALPDVSPIADPRNDTRQILVNPADPTASPFGWHDTNGVAGPEFTDTRGNNVFAQTDLDDNDFFGGPDVRPNGGPSLFFNNPVDYSRAPDTYLHALVTNLFYMNNVLHDVHERYGFTEAAGNFQQRNYTGATGDKDPVQADAMDGWNVGSANNAFMGTPPDGSPPRMSMFRWTFSNPHRDSDLENGIIAHEFGHGVSNRLTGGKANASALQSTQSRGMGEGWSDFYAIMFTQSPASTQNGAVPLGNYVINEGPTGGGIRQYPYSYDISLNRSTFGDYNSAGGTQQHFAGQIWASALWDLNWLLINKWGYDADIGSGYTAGRSPGNGPGGAGNKLTMKLVMDAMKLQPANPSFAAARNALLDADQALTGGLNKREIWRAFSRRGLGSGSNGTDPAASVITVSTDMPAAAAFPAVIAQSPYGPSAAPAGTLTLTFSRPMDKASFDLAADVVSFTGPGGADLRASLTGFSWNTDGTALTVTFDPPASPQGRYALTLSPDVLSAGTDPQKLDQNFGGDPGGISNNNNDRYTAYWGVDAAPLTVTSVAAVNGGALQSGEDSVVVTFSEPVAPGSLGVGDLQTTNGEVVAFVQIAPNQVRYDITQLAAGPLYYSLKLSAVTDAYGFGSRVLNGSLTVVAAGPEIDVTPLPPAGTPLTRLGPVGWQAYQAGLTTWINTAADTDTFTVTLDAGTRVTAVVDQTATLHPVLTVTGPLGTVVGTAQAAGPGGAAVVTIDLGPTGVAGDYRLTVSRANGTTGAYRARLVVGAATEPEASGGAANNTLATAQPFDLIPYGDGAAGAAVTGAVGQTLTPGADPADVFSVELAAGDTLAVGLSGGGANVRLLTSNGAPVGTATTPTNFDRNIAFTATAAGTYYVELTSTGGVISAPYLATVVKNGVIERESNGTSLTAQPLPAAGGVVRGGLEGVEDDFYSIVVPANGTLTISTSTPGGGPGEYANALDPVVTLFRGASTVGSDDNNGGDGKNALLRRTNLTAGTYVIKVSSARSTDGEYFLRVLTTANPGPTNVGPTVVTADRYTVAEGGSVTLTATGADGNGDPLTFSWDLNGDGVYTDAAGPTPTLTWAQLQALAPAVDNAPALFRFPVRVRATDGATTVTSPGVALTVTNTAPTGTPTAGRQVGESEAVLVGFEGAAPTAAEEPSAADRAAGLRYVYDYDANGTWDTGDRTGSYATALTDRQTTIPLQYIADGPGGFTARVRVIDQDGGFTDYPVTFTVINTAPVGSFVPDPGTQTPANPFLEGQTGRTLAIDQVLDSAVDRAAGFVYSFSFDGGVTWVAGDGVTPTLGDFATSVPLPTGSLAIPAAALADGPGTVTITGKVFDKDGAGATFTRTLAIQNVAPTAPIDPAQSTSGVNEGGTARVVLAPPLDPSQGDRARGFQYAYSLDGGQTWLGSDGTPSSGNWTEGSTSTSGTFTVPAAAVDDGSRTVTVTSRVIDRDNGSTDSTLPIVVRNVAPTATPVAAPNVVVGRPLTVSLTNPIDPSQADRTAGFRYSFDFNNDNDFRDPGEVSGATTPTADFTYQVPGAVRIRVRVTDQDGGFTDYVVPVSVDNVAPTAAADAVQPINEGGTGTIRLTASHPSQVTTAATFRYAYDFDGDGTFDVGGSDYGSGVRNGTVTIPSTFVSDGGVTRNARVRVYEVNGLFTDVLVPVTVANVAPTARLVPPTGRIEVRSGAAFTVVGQADPSPQDLAAGLRYSWDFNNDGDFADPSELVDSPAPAAAAEFTRTGPQTVRVRVTDKDGGFTDLTALVTVGTVTKTWYAAGVDAGNAPVARLYDTAGNTKFSGLLFDANATGGVRVVSADVNGDGTPDLIAATGPGVPAQVKVVDGKNGGTLFDVRPFGTFTGGAFVAAGDVDGDGFADVAVTPDEGGGPRVVTYSGRGFRQTGSFFGIADPNFRGGARVAMADVNGDGNSDLLVAAGFGGGPRVAGYDGATLFSTRQKLFGDFFAFDPALRNGVYLSGGDLTGDGRAELVVGAGPGGGPQVLALDGAGLLTGRQVEQASFFAADIANRDGVRVTVADIDADGRADIVTGDASGPKLQVFRGADIRANGFPADPLQLLPFDALTNGVFVG